MESYTHYKTSKLMIGMPRIYYFRNPDKFMVVEKREYQEERQQDTTNRSAGKLQEDNPAGWQQEEAEDD